MADELRLTIVLADPPEGFAFCLQRGKGAKAERLAYIDAAGSDISFDLTVAVRQGKIKTMPDFGGPFVQGRPGERFFYLCVGRCSELVEPQWSGRVKVPLSSITWRHIEDASADNRRLRARYAASKPGGGPALASVRLLDDGWTTAGSAEKEPRLPRGGDGQLSSAS